LQYLYQPVEDLKRLSQEVQPGSSWDLSVDTLRQVVLSLPKHESAQEQSLARINSLILQLSEPPQLKQQQLTAGTIGQQLWRELLGTMAGEAMWLRDVMGLPERDTQIHEKEEPPISDADMADTKDEKSEKKGGAAAKEERSGVKSRVKEDSKVESKSATTEKSVEDSKKKGKRREDVVKSSKEKQGKETASLTDTTSQSVSQEFIKDPNVEPEAMGIYKRLLHSK
ncbi:MYCBP-associated protein-like, partial [Notothenia coriiceps]|uniref:MYCBP-associated protein-like n=1 Tax=Notothenia coriiceps TaxID=8208 RepID=A0A6I9Q612_9TELE